MNDIAQLIQYSLTPGVMMSSSALFLMGIQNRFSNLFSRFRALNQERRSLECALPRNSIEEDRFQNVTLQLDALMKRVRAIKNAILCFYAAILFFIATSLCLLLSRCTLLPFVKIGLFVFLGGMACIVAACLLLISEIRLSFHIIQLERRS